MSFRFFVSSAPRSALQLLNSDVQCMDVQLLVSSAVTWTLQLTLCFWFPLLSPALLNSGVQCMSFRFFCLLCSTPNSSTPQLLNSTPQARCSMQERSAPCLNYSSLVFDAAWCSMQQRSALWFLCCYLGPSTPVIKASAFGFLSPLLLNSTPQARCSMQQRSAPCFLCCHLYS